jgi:uncharacterized protein (TIGR02271 family)
MRDNEVVRHEEELAVEKRVVAGGEVRAHKRVETEHVERLVARDLEDAEVERVAAAEADSGEVEVLADGSVSIPLLEEELVIEKRIVVRERIIVRKVTTTEDVRVEADLRRERVDVEERPR